jgi:hypothetical protein
MTWIKKLSLYSIAALALLAAPSAFAQQAQGTPIQQIATRLDACTVANATAVINNAVTLTITPPAGQYVYLCGIDLTVSNDATGAVVATNLQWTSTNLGAWKLTYSMAGTANTIGLQYQSTFNAIMKSAVAGTAVTIVSPAANAHAVYNVNAYYYYAP